MCVCVCDYGTHGGVYAEIATFVCFDAVGYYLRKIRIAVFFLENVNPLVHLRFTKRLGFIIFSELIA